MPKQGLFRDFRSPVRANQSSRESFNRHDYDIPYQRRLGKPGEISVCYHGPRTEG